MEEHIIIFAWDFRGHLTADGKVTAQAQFVGFQIFPVSTLSSDIA
jgi:hypothetical protein